MPMFLAFDTIYDRPVQHMFAICSPSMLGWAPWWYVIRVRLDLPPNDWDQNSLLAWSVLSVQILARSPSSSQDRSPQLVTPPCGSRNLLEKRGHCRRVFVWRNCCMKLRSTETSQL